MELNDRIDKLSRDISSVAANLSNVTNAVLPALSQIQKELIRLHDRQEILEKNLQLLMAGDILHVSTYDYGNVGDRILCDMVKRAIQHGFPRQIDWSNRGVGDDFHRRESRLANNNKAIVVGGGGLFFNRGSEQKTSWQWNVSDEAFDELKIPLFVFGVGYNQFRRQGELPDSFRHDVNRLAQKSMFIGLRNHGSIEAVGKYLLPENRAKLVYQPCPTTIISKICPSVIPSRESRAEEKFIAVNMAFDRHELRFNNGEDNIMGDIINGVLNVLRIFQKQIKIKYYSHFDSDKPFLEWMDKAGIDYELVDLFREDDTDKIYEAYAKPELVIGMRGHAQMIPFGMGVPILSIITHNKMKWFLEDIGHMEWGADVCEQDFPQKLYDRAINILNNRDAVRQEIFNIQDKLYDVTVKNTALIHQAIQ